MGRFIKIAAASACAGIMGLALAACSQKVLTNIESFQNLPPNGAGRTVAILPGRKKSHPSWNSAPPTSRLSGHAASQQDPGSIEERLG
jgi:hypothetical protein